MKHGWSHKRDGEGTEEEKEEGSVTTPREVPSNFLAVAVPMIGNVDVTDQSVNLMSLLFPQCFAKLRLLSSSSPSPLS